jgi:hypothetical protein
MESHQLIRRHAFILYLIFKGGKHLAMPTAHNHCRPGDERHLARGEESTAAVDDAVLGAGSAALE